MVFQQNLFCLPTDPRQTLRDFSPSPAGSEFFDGVEFPKFDTLFPKKLTVRFSWNFLNAGRLQLPKIPENSTMKYAMSFEGARSEHAENRLDGHYNNIQTVVKHVILHEYYCFLNTW